MIKSTLLFFSCAALALPVYQFGTFVFDGSSTTTINDVKNKQYDSLGMDFHCLQQCRMNGYQFILHCEEMCNLE